MIAQTWLYALQQRHELWLATRAHLSLSLGAVLIAAALAVPLGIWTSHARFGRSVINIVAAIRVLPSLAILALALPVLGIGFLPSLLALIVLACPPILINTDVAFRGIAPEVREAAVAMGMRRSQLLRQVEYPLAFPVVVAGMRTGTVEVIASATLAAFIGGGGLGTFILDGLANNDMRQLLLGACCVAVLALIAEAVLGTVTRYLARRYGRLIHV